MEGNIVKVKLVFNSIIPFKGYKAITLYPWIFVRKDASKWTLTDERHETTHLFQQEEVMIIAFAILWFLAMFDVLSWWWMIAVPFVFYAGYVLEWIIRIPLCGFDTKLAYYNISTEQEAYLNQDDAGYNNNRKPLSWVKYLFKKSFVRDKNTHKIVKRQ